MASTKQLVALFRALAAENLGSAAEVAAQICNQEERRGHHTAARMLRGALNATRSGGTGTQRRPSLEHANGASILAAALTRIPAEVGFRDVTLSAEARRELESLALEWEHRERLVQRGIGRRSKLLFHGPPGCGKSMTASALAAELALPLFLVRFDAVIGAYLGQTAIHLRQLFHFAETTPCVLLFDELDALGKRRGNPADVGELDRIVIALMQELEHAHPQGIVVGTSNLPGHLDDALWRRFDFALEFKRPTKKVLAAFARRIASDAHMSLTEAVLAKVVRSQNFADAEAIVVSEIRRQAILGF
jgi:SpoVK/Ycf46/Vps4 family AAA+-type ATPase